MKRKISILTLLTLISLSGVLNAQCLVASYPFNSNANDISGNGNNGIVTGATLTTDRFGNANSAYYFNGSNCNISVPTSTSLNNISQGPLTMSCWVNSATYTSEPMLFYGTVNTFGGGYVYYFGEWTGQKYNFRNWDQNNGSQWDITAPNSYNFNQWYFLTITIDPATNVSNFYIDGQLVGSSTNTVHTLPPPVQLYIGRSNSSNGIFNGKIDDITIYGCLLSQTQIDSLYNLTTTVLNLDMTENTILIYPNPTNSLINIDFGNEISKTNYSIIMENTLGQVVYQTLTNQQIFQVDVNSLCRKGIYFVKIIDNTSNIITTRKIILN